MGDDIGEDGDREEEENGEDGEEGEDEEDVEMDNELDCSLSLMAIPPLVNQLEDLIECRDVFFETYGRGIILVARVPPRVM